MIAGSSEDLFINRRPLGAVDDELLNMAKDNLEKHFFFVGIQERFDESFILWARKIGWRTPRYVSANRQMDKLEQQNLDSSLIARIKEKNSVDVALYDYCLQRFEKECALSMPDRDEALGELATQNARYARGLGRIQRFWDAVKPGLKYES
jgi:hypothetical protein